MEARFRSEMKVPNRPAPPLPGNSRKSQQSASLDFLTLDIESFNGQNTNSNLDMRHANRKNKKPPPRPPPPKTNSGGQSKVTGSFFPKFGRNKEVPRNKAAAMAIVKPLPPVMSADVAIDSLIDFQSPSSSPTFSKSSIRSFEGMSLSLSKSSNIESGFEDDFDSFAASNSTTPNNDPFSVSTDPFLPVNKVYDPFDLSNEDPKAKRYAPTSVISVSQPTIIRVKSKPARPPPPKKGNIKNEYIVRKIGTCTPDKFDDTKVSLNWSSPPMPTIPPPPPPPEVVQVLLNGPPIPPRPQSSESIKKVKESKTPYCVAEYDYEGTQPDDLSFKAGDVITLLCEMNSDWLKGQLMGREGIFPRNYVSIVVPLIQEEDTNLHMTVIALYNFVAETWDDLDFQEGEEIIVLRRLNEDWLYGECNGRRGQFPENYVQDITPLITQS